MSGLIRTKPAELALIQTQSESWKHKWWNEEIGERKKWNKISYDYFGLDSSWRVMNIHSQILWTYAYCLNVGSVAFVFILLHIQCVWVSQLLFSRWYFVGSSKESVNAVDHLLAFLSTFVLEPGALMFQHADVGKSPAAPVVVPVSLVLSLQSPSAASCWWHAAAGAGASRAPVLKHTDLQLRTQMSRRILQYKIEKVWEGLEVRFHNQNNHHRSWYVQTLSVHSSAWSIAD